MAFDDDPCVTAPVSLMRGVVDGGLVGMIAGGPIVGKGIGPADCLAFAEPSGTVVKFPAFFCRLNFGPAGEGEGMSTGNMVFGGAPGPFVFPPSNELVVLIGAVNRNNWLVGCGLAASV